MSFFGKLFGGSKKPKQPKPTNPPPVTNDTTQLPGLGATHSLAQVNLAPTTTATTTTDTPTTTTATTDTATTDTPTTTTATTDTPTTTTATTDTPTTTTATTDTPTTTTATTDTPTTTTATTDTPTTTTATTTDTPTTTTATTPSPIAALKTKIETTYGFSLDNEQGLQALHGLFKGNQTKQAVGDVARMKAWTLEELQYLDQALKNYAPLLGSARPATLGAQPLTSLSRAEMRVAPNGNNDFGIKTRPTVSGTTFGSAQNITMFSEAHKPYDFTTGEQQFRGTVEHELSHALIEKLPATVKGKQTTLIEKYWKVMPFWKGRALSSYWRQSGGKGTTQGSKMDNDATKKAAKKAKVEVPITDYGMSSAQEDLAEAMMFFFEDPQGLKDKCPERFQFLLDNLKDNLDPEHIKRVEKL
jgi:hypothetical protein